MPPPKRPPSSTTQPAVEVTAPGAIREPGTRPESDTVSTVPPPAPDVRPFPRSTLAGIRLPSVRQPPPLPVVESVEKTIAGPLPVLAPLPPPRSKLDSQEVANETLLAELADAGREKRAAEALAEQLRLELAAKVAVPPQRSSLRAVERSERHVAWLKLIGAVVAVLGAGTTYLSIRANVAIEPKIDTIQYKQDASKLTASTDHDTLLRVLEYQRADRSRQDCLEGQIGSAFVRGTGHRITGLADSSVEWAEQVRAPTKLTLPYERSVWFTVEPCPAAPRPP